MSRVLTDRTPAEITRRADAEAEVGIVGPVDQVVPRLVSGRAKLEISYISSPAAASRSIVVSYICRSTSSSIGWTRPACLWFQSAVPFSKTSP